MPVMEYTITEAEVEWFSEHGRKAIPKGQTWQQLGEILASQPDGGDEWLHKHMPAPGRLAWRLIGRREVREAPRRARGRADRRRPSEPPLRADHPRRCVDRAGLGEKGWPRRDGAAQARPCSKAKTTSCTRSRSASFVRMRLMCVFTVASLRNSRAAISAFDRPARGEREDLALALGQVAVGGRNRPGRGIREVREEVAGGGCRDHGRSGMHRADRREQELGVGVLQQEPARPLPDRPRRGLVEVEGREHHDAGRLGVAQQLGGRREAVHHRHPDVHQHDVGPRPRARPRAPRGRRMPRRRPRGRAASRPACGCRRGTAPGRRRAPPGSAAGHASRTAPIGSDAPRTTNSAVRRPRR